MARTGSGAWGRGCSGKVLEPDLKQSSKEKGLGAARPGRVVRANEAQGNYLTRVFPNHDGLLLGRAPRANLIALLCRKKRKAVEGVWLQGWLVLRTALLRRDPTESQLLSRGAGVRSVQMQLTFERPAPQCRDDCSGT